MADRDTLKIQEQLNKLLNDRRNMLVAHTREMQGQLQVALQLKSVMDGLSAEQLTDRLNEAQKALEGMAEKTQGLDRISSEAMASVAKGAEKATKQTSLLEKQTKLLLAKYPALKNTGTAALSGLSQGFTNLLALLKGAGGATETLVSTLFNVGKAIVAIPLRIFQGLLDTAASFPADNSLAQAFENLRKTFGSFKEDVSKNVIGSFHEIQKGLTGTGLSAWRVFGPLSEQLKYFTEIAEKAGAQIHNFGSEMAKTAGSFAAFEKGLAVGDNMKAVMDRATESGTSLSEQFRQIANYSLQMGKSFGISQKVIAKDIGMMMKDVRNFGSLTQKEMSVTAIYTRKLGIEVKSLLGLIDKFDTFEDAATSAAQLNQAFGASIDAFQLMQEQDPAKRIDMLRKSMAAAGKTAENMSRQELKLLAQTTGLDEATAKLAFSAKNQGVSYDDVRKKSEAAEKSQLTQAQALAKLADSIERFIGPVMQLKGSFWKMFIEGFEMGVKNSRPFLELMINLRRALFDTMMAGRQVGLAFVKFFPGVSESITSLSKMFSPGRFRKLLDGVVGSFTDFFKEMDTGKFSLKNLIEKLQKNFLNWFDMNSAEGKGLLDGTRKIFTALAGIFGQGIRFIVEKLTGGLTFLADFIKDPSGFLAKIKGGAAGAKSGAMGILQPLLDSLADKKLWQNLYGALKNLMSVVFDKLKAYFTGPEFTGIVKSYWPIIAGIVFGPAFTRILAATFIQAIAKAFMNGTKNIGGMVKGGIDEVAKQSEKAAGAGLASKFSEKNLPTPEAQSGITNFIKSMSKVSTGQIVSAGLKTTLLSVFIGTSLVALITAVAASAKVIEAFDVKPESFTMAIGSLAAITLATIPLMFATKIASALPLSEVLKGTAALAIVVGAMAGTLGLISLAFKGLNINNAGEISKSLSTMSGVFIVAGGVALVALGLGATLSALGPFSLLAVAGLAAMGVVIEAMALTAIGIMKQIDLIPFTAGFGEKVKAFTDIVKAIGSLSGNLASLISAATPSWMEILTGSGTTIDSVQKLQGFVESFIGHIQGMVSAFIGGIQQLATTPEMMKAAEAFGSLLSGVSTLAQALVPPPETKTGFDSVMNVIRGESSDTQLVDITNYVKRMSGNITTFVVSIKDVVRELAGLGITEQGLKGIDAFSRVMSAVTGILSAIKPSPELLREMRDSATSEQAWGLMKEGMNTLNPAALTDLGSYFKMVLGAVGPLIKTISGEAVAGVINAAAGLDPRKMDKIKMVLQIVSSVSGFMSTLSEFAKHGDISEITNEKDIRKSVTTTFPKFSDILSGMKNVVPKLVDSIVNLVIPTDKGVGARLDILKKTFESLSGIGSVFKAFTGDGGNVNAEQMNANVDRLASAINMIFFMKGANATGIPPIRELLNHINYIGDHLTDFQITGKGQQAISGIKNIGESLTVVTSALAAMQSAAGSIQNVNLSNVLPAEADIDQKLGLKKIKPFLTGLSSFATELKEVSNSVAANGIVPSIKAVTDIITSVNNLNKLLADGETAKIPISTTLKRFVDGAGLGSKASYKIENKGIQLTVNLEVKMSADEVERTIVHRKESIIRDGIKDSPGLSDEERRKLNTF